MAREELDAAALNRDAVIQAALALLDEAGVDGLSMRALADRLGVKAASLYWHLRDKDQLLELVAEAVLDRFQLPIAPGAWRPQVEDACDRLTRYLGEHNAAAAVVLGCLPVVRRSHLARDLARILASAGLEDAEPAAFALVVEATAAAYGASAAAERPAQGERMTLAIDSGSWRIFVRAAPPGAVDVARSAGGGGAAALEVRPGGIVVVHNRRGGNRGAVELNRDYTWQIKVHGGSWNNTLDLTGLRVAGVELDSGSGKITCTLPAPVGVVPVRVNSGIVGVTLHRPAGTAAHATVSTGSVRVRLDGQSIGHVGSDVHWESSGATRGGDRYELAVYSGCVGVTLDASAPAAAPPPRHDAAADSTATPPARPDVGVSLMLDGVEKRLTG
jgi:AcrR family transcriptional regulator